MLVLVYFWYSVQCLLVESAGRVLLTCLLYLGVRCLSRLPVQQVKQVFKLGTFVV